VPEGGWPVLIWSSGSAFLSDDGKMGAADAAAHFTAAGWVVAGVSVRSSTQAHFPAQLYDIKGAIRWLRAHAGEHGIDADRFAIMGNSSGGWLAAMAALTSGDHSVEGDVGDDFTMTTPVQAGVDLYGPTDFLQMDAHMTPESMVEFNGLLQITGGHDDAGSPESRLVGAPIRTVPHHCEAANPVRHASKEAPPLLIVHGQADPFVPHHQSELLYAALREAGGDVTFVSIPDNRHEHPYLDDPSRSAGRVVQSSRHDDDPDVVALRGSGPTWAVIEAFLRRAIG
jgi:acetyl esterase/lipase